MILISDVLFFGDEFFFGLRPSSRTRKEHAVWETSVGSVHQLQWSEASTLVGLGERAVLSPTTQTKYNYFYVEQYRKKCVNFKDLRAKQF